MTYRLLDLFSGIGGFALAATWAGYTPVQFVEIDPFCQRVLGKHWPEVPIHDDIHSFDGAPFRGTVDLLTGGFPCQPYSVAGKRGGAGDDRALWPQMRRVIDEARPHWVVAENVPGFIGLGLDDCLADLDALGYETGALVVPAAGVGAPHIRQRVWIVAHADESGRRAREPHVLPGRAESDAAGSSTDVAHADCGGWREPVRTDTAHGARPAAVRTQGADGTRPGGTALDDTHERRHGPSDDQVRPGRSAALDPDWWAAEPGVGRVAHGIPRRMERLRALGNAIVPQVAYEIIRHLEPSLVTEAAA